MGSASLELWAQEVTTASHANGLLHDRAKRPLDILIALVGLIPAGPVMLVLAVLIRLTSKGPAFYSQERLGRSGNVFKMLKLRTMEADAEADGPRWAVADDPRVTRIGRFLRKTHLDELPQLINVLRGEMSIVGPRPERPCFVQRLQGTIPLYPARLAVKPGITGLAQVKHHYDRTIEDVQTKLAYDLEYIRSARLLLDLQILVWTAVKIVSGRSGSG